MEFVASDEVRRIKARLDHPVIDSDGHAIEYLPLVRDILTEQAGEDAVGRARSYDGRRRGHARLACRSRCAARA